MKYIIYKITIADYTYIGSTKDFTQRKIAHKCVCKTKDLKVYQMIREAGGWDKCEMIPIEEYECQGQLQARIREEYWRREYNANMNSYKAYTTEEQKKGENNEWNKQYYKENKETINTLQNEIYICECGIKNTIRNKARHEKTKKHLAHLEKQNLTIL